MTPAVADGGPVGGGPKVVAVGGGHGLAATLRAVRRYTDRVTAVVSVADDGGSSGRLRELLGIIPPGDLRKCLVALAEPGSRLAAAFEYRFAEDELAGHSLGNLLLAGLMDGTEPVGALDEACRLLGVRGRVLPATVEPVMLKAEAASGPVAGQVAVMGTDNIRSVSLVPSDPEAPARGGLRTGRGRPDRARPWLPVHERPGRAGRARGARRHRPVTGGHGLRVQPSPQIPETEGFDVARHVGALGDHGVRGGHGGLRHHGHGPRAGVGDRAGHAAGQAQRAGPRP